MCLSGSDSDPWDVVFISYVVKDLRSEDKDKDLKFKDKDPRAEGLSTRTTTLGYSEEWHTY